MRVFIAVRHSTDPAQFYGGLWSANFYPALRELGHELVESQTDLAPTSRFMDVAGDFTAEELAVRTRTTEDILAEVAQAQRSAPIDLFLSYFYNSHFDPAGFDELRRLGIPSINFYCNSIYQFANVALIAAQADVSWHPERDARASYLAVGANPVCIQMGADPQVYHPIAGLVRQPNACFVGQRYADREVWMAALVQADLPVDIYGLGWGAPADANGGAANAEWEPSYLARPRYRPGSRRAYLKAFRDIMARDGAMAGFRRITGRLAGRREHQALLSQFEPLARGAIPFQRVSEIFARSEVCLNFSNVWADGQPGSRLIPHVRLRDFEGPMCRTCYLTGHTDEITEFYDVGREIDTYQTAAELVDKVRFYLSHPADAERLREAGYRRALSDHTWRRRFQALFAKVGLPARQ